MTSLHASSALRSLLLTSKPSQAVQWPSLGRPNSSLATRCCTPLIRAHHQCKRTALQRTQAPLLPASVQTQLHRAYAIETAPNSSVQDPSDAESQKLLAAGTAALEAGDMEGAKVRWRARSLEEHLKGQGKRAWDATAKEHLGFESDRCLVPRAKTAYEQSLRIKENASAHFNLGVCRYHARECAATCAALGGEPVCSMLSRTATSPLPFAFWHNWGRTGDLEGAVQSWEAVLKLSPQSPDAHTNIASCYVLSKPARPDLALEHLKKASALAPEDAEIHYNMAAVLEAVENLEECLVAYQRALAGGISRAEQNIRNVQAKILGAKAANEANAENSGERRSEGQ